MVVHIDPPLFLPKKMAAKNQMEPNSVNFQGISSRFCMVVVSDMVALAQNRRELGNLNSFFHLFSPSLGLYLLILSKFPIKIDNNT